LPQSIITGATSSKSVKENPWSGSVNVIKGLAENNMQPGTTITIIEFWCVNTYVEFYVLSVI